MVLDRRTVALAAAVVVVAVFCLKLRAPNGEFTCIHAVDAMAPKMLIIVQHIATLFVSDRDRVSEATSVRQQPTRQGIPSYEN